MGKQRLELTWIGKNTRPKLEPRILIEDPEKSFGSTDTENMLIHGDNLLALKALEQEYAGRVKCIFIDPPYNTGNAFEHYEDGLEHSIWLGLMRDRLLILRNLLSEDGMIFITLDDNEAHYCKVLCDEIFGRINFVVNVIWEKSDSPRMDAEFFSNRHDHVLIYSKNISQMKIYKKSHSLDNLPSHYNKVSENGIPYYLKPLRAMGAEDSREDRPSMYFPITAPDGTDIFPIRQDGSDGRWRWGENKVKENSEKIEILKTKNGWSVNYRIYADTSTKIPPESIWYFSEVGTNRTSKSEIKKIFGKKAFDTPKPEALIKKIIELSTLENDIVLDSFLGSGTTAAVSHKLGRKWIGVELGDHCYTHCKPRLDKVISGDNFVGISSLINWKGGGGYKFYELAPSLLNKDTYGNWIINQDYNADMLAAAMAKQEGFRYNPDPDLYWKQGQSTEQDFIFTTTEFLTQEHLELIHSQMKDGESLLICCKAFNANDSHYPNITIKKIPKMLMGKCEFGKNDYSLNIINIPTDDNEEDSPDTVSEVQPKYVAGQGELFDMEGDDE